MPSEEKGIGGEYQSVHTEWGNWSDGCPPDQQQQEENGLTTQIKQEREKQRWMVLCVGQALVVVSCHRSKCSQRWAGG